jgi:hypothetical protein
LCRLAAYDFTVTDEPVCLKNLLNTFGVENKRIRVKQYKLKDGKIAPIDKRGGFV